MDLIYLIMVRRATWQRAKGELLSILEYYESSKHGDQEAFDELDAKIGEFIKWMDKESPIA